MDQEKSVSVEAGHQTDESSRLPANEAASEAVIDINLNENRQHTTINIGEEHKDWGSGGKGSDLDQSIKVKNVEEEAEECVMDVNCCEGDENDDKLGDLASQRVCRICHLSAWESGKSLLDLIELGCGCKGELGFAHPHCAESWFKLKGNRICEICGENAKNITGAVDNKFMEEWNENRSTGSTVIDSSERSRGCWQGQPLCNFLMACLVIAFVLPWFFRVNMF